MGMPVFFLGRGGGGAARKLTYKLTVKSFETIFIDHLGVFRIEEHVF
jgi:hypothetical protein